MNNDNDKNKTKLELTIEEFMKKIAETISNYIHIFIGILVLSSILTGIVCFYYFNYGKQKIYIEHGYHQVMVPETYTTIWKK